MLFITGTRGRQIETIIALSSASSAMFCTSKRGICIPACLAGPRTQTLGVCDKDCAVPAAGVTFANRHRGKGPLRERRNAQKHSKCWGSRWRLRAHLYCKGSQRGGTMLPPQQKQPKKARTRGALRSVVLSACNSFRTGRTCSTLLTRMLYRKRRMATTHLQASGCEQSSGLIPCALVQGMFKPCDCDCSDGHLHPGTPHCSSPANSTAPAFNCTLFNGFVKNVIKTP